MIQVLIALGIISAVVGSGVAVVSANRRREELLLYKRQKDLEIIQFLNTLNQLNPEEFEEFKVNIKQELERLKQYYT
jgi:Na+-transporting NADH:ubiquinone oxidoreductase subunit NqrC